MSTLGQWQAIEPGSPRSRCSRARCYRAAVSRLNRGQYRYGGRVDAWWHYCVEHLAEYGRVVRDGQIVYDREAAGTGGTT